MAASNKITRPKGYGLTAATKNKINAKYDEQATQNCRLWMEDVTGTLVVNPPDDIETADQLNEWRYNQSLEREQIYSALCDGRYLCMLMNTIMDGAIPKFNEEIKNDFKKRENIEKFLSACTEKLGCKGEDLFAGPDLSEQQNMGQVITCIYAVARKAALLHEDWPTLGPAEAQYCPRCFTEEQMKEGQKVIGLQMGTNKCASQAGLTFGKQRFIID